MATLYDRLGVAPGASDAELRRGYLAMARRHHPDAGGDSDEMRALNEAWAVLSDPARRRVYDGSLGTRAEPEAEPDADVDADDLVDWFDDRPVRATTASSSLSVAPAALFAGALGTALLGVVLAQSMVLAFAGFLAFLSVIALAAVALLTLRGPR